MLIEALRPIPNYVLPTPPRAVTVTNVQNAEATELAQQRAHVPPLEAGDLAGLIPGYSEPKPILAFAHSVHKPETTGRSTLAKPVCRRHGIDLTTSGEVRLTPGIVHYKYPNESGIIALQHMVRAEANADQLDLLMTNTVITLPGLCRAKPMALIINAILEGTYDPTADFRPACHSCQQRNASNRCGAQPPPLTMVACCPNSPSQDWCVAYRNGPPAAKAVS